MTHSSALDSTFASQQRRQYPRCILSEYLVKAVVKHIKSPESANRIARGSYGGFRSRDTCREY